MTDIVERVARAIEDKFDEGASTKYDRLGYESAVELARVAITEMRKPTEGMCDAAIPKLLYDDQRDCIADAYTAMLDEALKP